MKEYDVKITETLEKTVTVQAESHDAAEEQVRAAYYNSEYILDSENFTGVAFGTTEEREVQKEQADTMNVLLVKPFMYPQAVQIGCELEDLQKAVGGDIEATYPFNEPVALVMHDEGKLVGKDLNRALRDDDGDIYDIIAGDFLVVGLGEDDFCSLSPELMKQFEERFHQPETFVRMGRSITLLSAMETAGADEMPDEVERKGLGTPATRAGIIEKLVRIGFLERKGDKKTKHLIPTHKGTALVTVMPEQIQSPSMTADWEEKLLLIEKGEYASEDFMDEIKDVIAGLIQNYEVIRDSEVLMSKEANSIGKCPLCGSAVEDKSKGYFCSNRGCRFALWKNNCYFASIGKSMTSATAQKLLGSGKVKLKNCKSERTGNTFDATVFMEVSEDGKTKFSMEFENGGKRK